MDGGDADVFFEDEVAEFVDFVDDPVGVPLKNDGERR